MSLKTVKCAAIGDPSVGKSSLLTTFATGTFPSKCSGSVFNNHSKEIIYESFPIRLELWDASVSDVVKSCEEDREKTLRLIYDKVDIVLICCAVDDPKALENVKTKWIKEVHKYAPSASCIIVGTKSDLRSRTSSSDTAPAAAVSCPEIAITSKEWAASSLDRDSFSSVVCTDKDLSPRTSSRSASSSGCYLKASGHAMAELVYAQCYLECSALSGIGIKQLLNTVLRTSLDLKELKALANDPCCTIL